MNARSARLSPLRRALLAAVAVQALILACYYWPFFSEMFRETSTLGSPLTPALAGSLALLAALAVSARLWSGPGAERFAASGLAHVAALALCHCAAGLLAGGLRPAVTAVFLSASLAAGAALASRRRTLPSARPSPPLGAWDAASAFVLGTLLIPTVFPYIHYDTKVRWACRAFALARTPSFDVLAACVDAYAKTVGPEYPPAWSILLWLGISDPIFQGRLLAWTLLPLFALFLRARLARVDAGLAPPAVLFTLLTVHVWDGAATYYADVPLMIFVTAGSLLALGLPRGREERPASAAESAAGALCLAAAALVRPDAVYCLAVVAIAAAWFRLRRESRFPAGAFLAAAAAAAAWALWRPAALRVAAPPPAPNELWRSAGATTGQALWRLLLTYLDGCQGQCLSHRGFGAAFYLLAGLAVWRARRRAFAGFDARFFGLVSLGSVAAVLLGFAALPFLNDARVPGASAPGTPYLQSYLLCIRTSFGRVMVHFYPFLILWGVAAVKDAETGAL